MRHDIEYPYKTQHKYPGLRPEDVALWDEFILNHPGAFNRVWYDIHIGDPVSDEKERQHMKESGMYDVSCWCVDVVADDGSSFWVIEVKPNALAGALGQALAYTKLLEKEKAFDKPLRPAVLTDNVAPITQQAAALLGVVIFTPQANKI